MDLINELSLVQKSAAGAAVVVLLVLLMVIARRQRSAAKPADDATPGERRRGRRSRSSEPSARRIPRLRRKLAQETAETMGSAGMIDAVEIAPAAAVEAEPLVARAAEVPMDVSETFEIVPPAMIPVVEPVPVGVMSGGDPYVTPVASPGWPLPGELASGFDPDAFDPLPDQEHEHDGDVRADDAEPLVAADDESEWSDEDSFDPATGWSAEVENPGLATAPAIDLWVGDDETPALPEAPPAVGEATIDLDELWEDSDEPHWDGTPEVTATSDVELETGGRDADLEDWHDGDDPADVEPPALEYSDETVELVMDEDDWTIDADETAVMWQSHDDPADSSEEDTLSVPFPLPGTIPTHDASASESLTETPLTQGGAHGPIVLDLAALASSGQPVELLIEPNMNGAGMRVRVGAVSVSTNDGSSETSMLIASEPAIPADDVIDGSLTVDVDEAEPMSVGDEFVDELWFVTGGAASSASHGEVGPPEPFAYAGPSFEATAEIELEAEAEVEGDVEGEVDVEASAAPEEEAQTIAEIPTSTPIVTEDDDPARILADIRARLAALDAKR